MRRYRALVTGLVLVPVNIFILMYMEVATNSGVPGTGGGPYPSTISLFANTILFLVMLTGINHVLRRRVPKVALDRAELLVVYVMLTISTAIVSIDFLDVLVPMITWPFRAATPENRYGELITPHIPAWISVRDPAVLKGWYEGTKDVWAWRMWAPWVTPVAVWSAVIFAMLFVMMCINTIVRQQWIQHDKLQFPLVELPIQVTDPAGELFRSRLMWLGFGISGGICLMNGLSVLYPSIPFLPVKMTNLAPLMPNKPWNAVGWFPISFYPYAIGLSFLLPVDMLFSCWFFFLCWKAVNVLGSVYGVYGTVPRFPYADQQSLGAYYLIGLFAVWSGRRHLRVVFRAAFAGEKIAGEAEGPMRYRTAVLGLILGFLAVVLFFRLIGLAWWMALAAIGLYFFFAMAVARIHAELGPPSHGLHFMGPEIVLTGALGTQAFSNQNLTAFGWFWWFNRSYRSIPIAYQLDGLKIAQRSRVSQRTMGAAIALASVAAVASGFAFYIYFGYTRGAQVGMAGHVNGFGWEAFNIRTANWIATQTPRDIGYVISVAWGMVFTYFLYFMKLRFAWWPFHPLGFAVSTGYPIHTIWVPSIIAWLAKFTVLRVGGLKGYRAALPFFLGLILGDFIVGALWPVVGWVCHTATYSFMQ